MLFNGNLVSTDRILYTPSAFAKTNLIHLQETGTLQANKPHISKRENLSSFLFFIVIDGEGSLNYDNQTYQLKQYDCVFINCKKPYYHSTTNNLWKLKWTHFNGPNMNAIYEKYKERGGTPTFHPNNIKRYINILDNIHNTSASSNYTKDMIIFQQLAELLSYLMEDSWHQNQTKQNTKKQNLQQIKDYIDQHYQEKITLDQLSQQFFINKYYLTRVFKEQFGITINTYIQQIRITHAKQLLRFTDLSIEKIANQIGIEDHNYFIRQFKQIEQITPNEYRKLWKAL